MSMLWSISTTVRNPERLREFLRVLSQLEGENFTRDIQIKYQVLLIKERLYLPTRIPQEHRSLFEDLTQDIPFRVAREVFDFQQYIDPDSVFFN